MSKSKKCAAIIVSAGRGHRFGGETPKQYIDLGGQSLLSRSVGEFVRHDQIGHVVVVIHPDDEDLYQAAIGDIGDRGNINLAAPVYGGEERQDSVRHGMESLVDFNPDAVLIHDAARPFVDGPLISRVIKATEDDCGAIPAVGVADTLKRVMDDGGKITETVNRRGLWRAQTPQGFPFHPLLLAHRNAAGKSLTDDAAVAEDAGLAVRVVDGAEENFKITSHDDLKRARDMMSSQALETRVGFGFDVHRFTAGSEVILCGVKIPHDHALEGHSDADVGMHALTDAVLGAAGAGDIGEHFPPHEAQWKDADSEIFLAAAGQIVRDLQGRIVNVDVTLICEFPKISDHRDDMRQRLADILNMPKSAVNIKATTTEKLGFTGRGEGIAAQAVASIVLRSKK